MDMPSVVVKGTGILLVLIGLSGVIGGVYTMKLVSDYDFGAVGAGEVKTSISDMTTGLEKNKLEVDSALTNTSASLKIASESMASAGVGMYSASQKFKSSSISLNKSAEQLDMASALNTDAGTDLDYAYEKLSEWSEMYTSNGSPLPQKSTFDSGIRKIKDASSKLEFMGGKLESSSKSLEISANELNDASFELQTGSEGLKDAGDSLEKSSGNLEKFKSPLVNMLTDIATPLEDLNSNIETITSVGSSMKTGAYAIVSYIILLHAILLFVGIALIVIEVNLFYPV